MGRIILASTSPRRKEILGNFNISFEVQGANVEEKIHEGELPHQVAMALAYEKAMAVAKQCDKEDIIIAADTIVEKNGILGKPKDYDDAFRMLKLLQNDIHTVITGLAVIEVDSYNKFITYEKTKVKIKSLTDLFIRRYINTGEVWDKAGSYGIQGKGSAFVEGIEGDYFNVVGLPIIKLQDILEKYFSIYLF